MTNLCSVRGIRSLCFSFQTTFTPFSRSGYRAKSGAKKVCFRYWPFWPEASKPEAQEECVEWKSRCRCFIRHGVEFDYWLLDALIERFSYFLFLFFFHLLIKPMYCVHWQPYTLFLIQILRCKTYAIFNNNAIFI